MTEASPGLIQRVLNKILADSEVGAVDIAPDTVDYRPMSDFQTVDMNEWRKLERINESQLRSIGRLAAHLQTYGDALREIMTLHATNTTVATAKVIADAALTVVRHAHYHEGVRSTAERAREMQDEMVEPPWDEEQDVLDEQGARDDIADSLSKG